MIKVEKIEAWGYEHAIRGMRNPLNSWAKSDSAWSGEEDMHFIVGDNDIGLMERLCKAGTEHRKYLRQIFVSMDITAPLYFWKEFDTYKIGVTANSCSTMHTIHKKKFELDDFSYEHLCDTSLDALQALINVLNIEREHYLVVKDKTSWWQLVQLLPSSYNQKRTVTMSYENALNMIHQRKNHKLDEWRFFVDILSSFPYMSELIGAME